MKNLFLYQHFHSEFPGISDSECFCVATQSEEVYVYGNRHVYKLLPSAKQVDIVFSLDEYYDTHIPAIVHISLNSLTGYLCLVFENGDVLTLDSNFNEIQCVGSVESGLKAVQWSPDQEVVVMVTGQNTVIVMTGTFDPIIEVDLNQNGFGEKQFITVGWGKKETQFHGSEGKAAAHAVRPTSNPVEQKSALDDGKPRISWRGDGSLFAVSTIKPDTGSRQIRIFSRDGVLQYTSELAVGLEEVLAWRPSGNLIATSQRLPNKHVIAFFEKNGLRHGEFTLPFARDECRIKLLAWNSESSILAVWCEESSCRSRLQLWTVNNYHWYLKQSLYFPVKNKLLGLEWDMFHGNRLHIMCDGLCYMYYDWAWSTCHTWGYLEDDGAFVAVIDGAKVLLTSFRHGITPPPLCNQMLELTLPVNSVIFAPPEQENNLGTRDIVDYAEKCSYEINSNTLATILSDGTVTVFTKSSSTKCHVQLAVCKLDSEHAADFHHWLWLKKAILLCCYTRGAISYVVEILLDFTAGKCNIRREVPTNGIITSTVLLPDGSGTIVQLTDGTLLIYKLGEEQIVPFSKPLPEACEKIQVCHVDGKDILFGLSSRNRLYVDGKEVANNVTSIVIHSEFILLTTLKHVLLCAQLSQKGLQSLIEGRCGGGRRIERGARLVTAVAGDTRVILQMPRGNLECVQPRPLTLHVAAVHLNARHYGSAFQLLRKQRINLNLLCDHDPSSFLASVDYVVEELKDPMWLSLFLSELQDDNVTHSMYKDYYAQLDQLPDVLTNKVQVVCDIVREAILRQENASQYLLPLLTTHVQKKSDKDLADALLRVKSVKETEKRNEALKYLLYLVDVNRLYDVALGLYDFDLVMLVAAKSNKDPKEYLPFLNELRRMEPNYSHFMIDKHLRRYVSALQNIALCSEENHFKECLDLIKTHKLYSQALELFPKASSRYLAIAALYADYLLGRKQYQEAGIMYTRAHRYEKALAAYQLAGDWRETLLAAKHLQYKENIFHELCRDLVLRLKNSRKFNEAAEILSKHLGDDEESIAVLVQGRLWDEAVWSSFHHKRTDMIETHVKPGMMEHLEQLSYQLTSSQEQFEKYKTRLSTVRRTKEQFCLEDKDGDVPDEFDLYSDTSSIMASSFNASHTGSRASGRSSRSSKNRRKQERKVFSLKEGSPYEELALIRALHQLITTVNNTTEEVHSLCRILLKFDKDKDAAGLQKLLSNLITEMDKAKQEIWTADLTQQTQMAFGPDATVNSITTKIQSQSAVNPDLSLLEPNFRFPPLSKSSTSWQISILKMA